MTRRLTALVATFALLAACGSESSGGDTTAGSTTLPATTTTVAPTTTAAADTTTAPTTAAPTTTDPAALHQRFIWPSADVVFATPEEAAADFVRHVLGEGPVLGAYQAGDSNSGEIEVFASVDGAPIGDPRSVLLMRMLGPDHGWFVLAAVSDQNTITAPDSMIELPAGPVTVEGMGIGFEATIVVNAYLVGHADNEFDREVAMAGNLGEPAPYSVTLDLSGAGHGDMVVLMVRGGAGLETDPGDFSAIAIRIL